MIEVINYLGKVEGMRVIVEPQEYEALVRTPPVFLYECPPMCCSIPAAQTLCCTAAWPASTHMVNMWPACDCPSQCRLATPSKTWSQLLGREKCTGQQHKTLQTPARHKTCTESIPGSSLRGMQRGSLLVAVGCLTRQHCTLCISRLRSSALWDAGCTDT